jgi:hypothetical protein
MSAHRYYGKYRGKVENNLDPLELGRLQVSVPAVEGLSLGWALPCTPYAGAGVGFYTMPPISANVWVEFEGGDPNYPIWAGCFWEEGEVPSLPAIPEKKVWQTEFITMVLNDLEGEGGFSLTVKPPLTEVVMSITINETGITLSCPESTIKMTLENIELTVPPASQTITAETIAFTVPESALTMSAETVEITVPPSTVTWSAETLELALPASTITMTSEAIEVEAPDINVSGAVEMEPELNVTGPVEIEGNLSVTGAMEVNGANVEITATAIELSGVGIVLDGPVEVNGVLLIDGQPPLML